MEKVSKPEIDIVKLVEQLGLDKHEMMSAVFKQEMVKVSSK